MLDFIKNVIRASNHIVSPVDKLFRCNDFRSGSSPVFIVGAPRTGTTLVYQIVTQQFNVGYFTEIMNYFYGLPNLIYRIIGKKLGRPIPVFESRYGKISGIMSPSENANFWFRWLPDNADKGYLAHADYITDSDAEEIRETIFSISGIIKRSMAFKSVYLSLAIPVLTRCFPDARFIFVRRNPIYVCQSLLKARMNRPDPNQWWSVKIPGYKKLLTLPIWKQIVNQVMYTDIKLQEDLEKYASGKYMIAQYESICNDPKKFINEVSIFIEPIGVNRYSENRIPDSFNMNVQITLDENLRHSINSELEKYK